jgi:hypothetical protein
MREDAIRNMMGFRKAIGENRFQGQFIRITRSVV